MRTDISFLRYLFPLGMRGRYRVSRIGRREDDGKMIRTGVVRAYITARWTTVDACGDTLGAPMCSISRQDNEETMLIEALSPWHAYVVLLTARAIGSHCQIARKAEDHCFRNPSTE